MHIFPQQAGDFHFMEVYKKFIYQYRDQYYDNRKIPNYTSHLKNPESTFLIFLPSIDKDRFHLGNFVNGLVYVKVEKINSSDIFSSTYKLTHFPFQNSRHTQHQQFIKAVASQTPYPQLEEEFAEHHEMMMDEKFDVFNRDCVFQLQPEHYHYFLPFFKHFTPYLQLAQRFPNNIFKSIDQPRNLLL